MDDESKVLDRLDRFIGDIRCGVSENGKALARLEQKTEDIDASVNRVEGLLKDHEHRIRLLESGSNSLRGAKTVLVYITTTGIGAVLSIFYLYLRKFI